MAVGKSLGLVGWREEAELFRPKSEAYSLTFWRMKNEHPERNGETRLSWKNVEGLTVLFIRSCGEFELHLCHVVLVTGSGGLQRGGGRCFGKVRGSHQDQVFLLESRAASAVCLCSLTCRCPTHQQACLPCP